MGPAEAFALLEIPATAAEDDIRRAYARRLKSFRPDEDPEGFQRLVQARGIALAQARLHARTATAPPRVVYGGEPGGAPSNPAPPNPPPAAGERPVEPDESGETTSGRTSAPAGESGKPPARQPSPPPPEPQKPSAPQPGASQAPENARPPSAGKSAPGAPSPAGAPETRPRPERDAVAPDRVVTPAEVHSALQLGLRRLVKEKKPFDVRGLEAMLLELPAGAGRVIERAAIQEVANALPILRADPAYPLPAVRSLEQLAVMLTDHFGWHDSDRVLFAALSPGEAARFEGFLRRAHEAHAPGRKTRFARPERPAAGAPKPQQKQHSSGPGLGWLVFVFIAMGALARMGSNHQPVTPRPLYNPSQNWLQPALPLPGRPNPYGAAPDFFVQHPEQLAKSEGDMQAKLDYSVDTDYKTLLAGYKARIEVRDRFPLRFVHAAADRYQSRGMHAEALSLLDRLIASKDLRPYRADLERYRGEAWLRIYGWSDGAACKRTKLTRPVTLTPEGEAHVRKVLQDAIDWAGREPSSSPAVIARLLELSDHLAGQQRFGELAAVLDRLRERASQGALLQANLQVEIGIIRRCMLPAAGRG